MFSKQIACHDYVVPNCLRSGLLYIKTQLNWIYVTPCIKTGLWQAVEGFYVTDYGNLIMQQWWVICHSRNQFGSGRGWIGAYRHHITYIRTEISSEGAKGEGWTRFSDIPVSQSHAITRKHISYISVLYKLLLTSWENECFTYFTLCSPFYPHKNSCIYIHWTLFERICCTGYECLLA
jgi:hypothetical protein